MMIRILCLSVLLLLFFTDIEARNRLLKCHSCIGKNCKRERNCASGRVCMSASVVALINGKQRRYYYRSCTSPSYCPRLGERETLSISVGSVAYVANVKCCNSRLCNKILRSRPKIPSGNGLTCLFCNNNRYPNKCELKECIGSQTHCVKVIRNGRSGSGCATKNFCQPEKIIGRSRYTAGFAGALIFPAVCENPKPVAEPTTVGPTTVEPTTAEPTTAEPTTVEPTTVEPTTVEPTTVEPTTVEPTTVEPTTVEPTTVEPTTAEPTTAEPTTAEPTTVEPTTVEPTTAEPTTAEPTTAEPTTAEPTTAEPTTAEPTTAEPTTAEPTTAEPTTVEPTTDEPTTAEPTTVEPTTAEPTTAEPTTVEPTTAEQTTAEPQCVPIETTPEPTLPPCGRKG